MLGLRGIALQLAAQMPHVNAQVVTALNIAQPPHLSEQLPLRYNAPRVADEGGQQAVFDGRESNRFARSLNGVRSQINLRVTERSPRVVRFIVVF